MRAVMDIGTNSCRLIIVETKGNRMETVCRRLTTTRIGQGLGRGNRCLSEEGMQRTLEALRDYSRVMANYPIERVYLIGTQALREAENSKEFCHRVKEALGWELDIISGQREAYLSYLGAVSALPELVNPVVLDIGGGSTEIMTATDNGIQAASAPLGGLRLLEKPRDDQVILQGLLDGWQGFELPSDCSLVGVGGTATTLGAIYTKMKVYDPEKLTGVEMSRQAVQTVLQLLESLTPQQRLSLPGMLQGREDILPWGLHILLVVMEHYRFSSLRICDRDLMYGILLETMDQ